MTTQLSPEAVDWTGLHSLLAIGMIVASGLNRGEPGYMEIIDLMKYGKPLPPECEDARDQCRRVLRDAMARLEAN